jgi:Putative zinc-finger
VTHDPATAAAYVSGELTGEAHAEFENHLLACEECWSEVETGRRGRELVERAREVAPEHLRLRIAALADGPRRRRRTVATVIAVAACLAALIAVVFTVVNRSSPAPLEAAVAGYRSDRLPGSRIPAVPAPDLSGIGLTQTAAGAGDLAGVPVTAYAYRDDTGRRLLIYVGERPFVTPKQAEHYGDADASWVSHYDGVSVLCSRSPHVTLVVGQDEKQVHAAANVLDLI